MTISTFTLFAITGGMLALKLTIMVMAVVLLAKALSRGHGWLAPLPAAGAVSAQKYPKRRSLKRQSDV